MSRFLPGRRAGHLVVVAPQGEADFLASTPVLEAAVLAPSWSSVTLLVPEEWAPVLAGGPCEAHVEALAGAPRARDFKRLAPQGVLLLDGSRLTAWRARRARVPLRVGEGDGLTRLLCTHSVVPASVGGHRVLLPSATLYRDLGGLAGVWARDLRPRLGVPRAAARVAEGFLADGPRPYALLDPYPDYGDAGAWPAERYAALAERLASELGLPAVMSVDGNDPELAREVAARAPASARMPPEELWTTSGRAALTQRAELCVVSSGAARLAAAAFGRGCIHLAGPGPTGPAIAGADEAWTVRVRGLECAPCLRMSCAVPGHPCMLELEPDAVLASAHNLRRARARRGGAGA